MILLKRPVRRAVDAIRVTLKTVVFGLIYKNDGAEREEFWGMQESASASQDLLVGGHGSNSSWGSRSMFFEGIRGWGVGVGGER